MGGSEWSKVKVCNVVSGCHKRCPESGVGNCRHFLGQGKGSCADVRNFAAKTLKSDKEEGDESARAFSD